MSQQDKRTCIVPKLPLENKELSKYYRKPPKLDCNYGYNMWVSCEKSVCKITAATKRAYGKVACSFKEFMKGPDNESRFFPAVRITKQHNLTKSDFAEVECKSSEGKYWAGLVSGFRKDSSVGKAPAVKNEEKPLLDVMMFGISSLSRNDFIRKLPQTYRYLMETLDAHVLESYNIIGDGKAHNLIPMLTGSREVELPETRKRITGSSNVHVFPFIWNEYKTMHYVTAFNEDKPGFATFNFRLKGFVWPPTTHYMRPLYMVFEKQQRFYQTPFCWGLIPQHQVMLNYVRDFMLTYEGYPKFSFSFLSELSEGYVNLISVADEDVQKWLEELKTKNALNNTILMIFSDHGTQFEDIRNILEGKIEERLPFFSFVFPEWFPKTYPEQYENFKKNRNRLTTPFDIHETLRDILRLQGSQASPVSTSETQNITRALSLFQRIPKDRTCVDADIDPQWCICLSSEWVPQTPKIDYLKEELTNVAINKINDFTSTQRLHCSKIMLKEILWIKNLVLNEKLLKYKGVKDIDGFQPDFTSNMNKSKDIYQIQFSTKPGNFIFRADVIYNFLSGVADTGMNTIRRIDNEYSGCVTADYIRKPLKEFCFCKNDQG